MKAKVSKWCEGERIVLADVVPLVTPISLMVEPSNACNFRCIYCPHGYMQANSAKHFNTIMDFSIFEKLVQDAKGFPGRIEAINLSRFGEPLLNRRLADMVRIAKDSNICNLVKIISNGSLLTEKTSLDLIGAGLDVLRISLQGISEKQVFETCGRLIDFPEFVGNIRFFYENRGKCRLFIKILDKTIEGSEDDFYGIFGDICDEIAIEHQIDIADYVAIEDKGRKQLKNMMGETIDNCDVCSSPFYSLNICADGSISPCCSDIEDKLVLGNILETSLVDAWNSRKMNQFRVMHLKGARYHHPVCGVCCGPTYARQSNDNIDGCRDRLLDFYGPKIKRTPG